MSTLELYYLPGSPPSRSVLLLMKYLGLNPNINIINLIKGDQHTPEYSKINPQHTIPAINDHGFILSESHAILMYLASKYSKNDTLYPTTLEKRAIVDHRLFFEMGFIQYRAGMTWVPILFRGAKPQISETSKKNLYDGLQHLDDYLANSTWIAGNDLTIADFASLPMIYQVTELDAIFDLSPYKNIHRWVADAAKILPEFEEINSAGLDMFKPFLMKKLGLV